MPAAWAAASAAQICCPYSATSAGLTGPAPDHARQSSPVRYSITRNGAPSLVAEVEDARRVLAQQLRADLGLALESARSRSVQQSATL
jgi:hypothetical protein